MSIKRTPTKNHGADKIRAGNRVLFGSLGEAQRKKVAQQNAYRIAAGLPPIDRPKETL